MIKTIEKHPITAIVLISLLMLLPNLDALTVTIMEARNFVTAREMIEDGNWVLTTMNGNPRYEKPPLPTWLTAFSGILFGAKSLFALRLPAALMISFSGIFMFLFSRKLLKSTSQSLINAFVLITSFYIIGIINEAPWDIFTHGFMLAGIYYLFQFFEEEKVIWKNALFAGFFVGLSLMCKGPVSIYALLLPFVISYAITFKFKNFRPKVIPLIAFILTFTLIGAWWFLYVRIADSEVFLEIAKQETSRWGSYNVRPFYYYWSFFVQSGIWTIPTFIGLIYPYLKKRVLNKKLYRFSFIWSIAVVVLLSVIPEKKSRYLVPVLFPLAINTGFYIEYLIQKFKTIKSKKETIPVYFNFGLFGLIGVIFPIAGYLLLEDKLDGVWLNFGLTSIALFSIGLLILINLKNKNIKKVFYATVGFIAFILMFGLPLSKAFYNNPNFNQISELKETIEVKHTIKSYTFEELTPELLWYYGNKIENIYINNTFVLPNENNFGILIEERNVNLLKTLPSNYSVELIDEFDLNFFKKKRNRLIRKYYLITKNNNTQ